MKEKRSLESDGGEGPGSAKHLVPMQPVERYAEADLPVAHVNPTYVRHLALGLKILAKTDPIDARVLVRYAELAEPVLLEKCTKNQAELAALVTCRRQLTQTLTQQANRRAMTRSTVAIKAVDKVIKTLEHQIAELTRQHVQCLARHVVERRCHQAAAANGDGTADVRARAGDKAVFAPDVTIFPDPVEFIDDPQIVADAIQF